MPDYSQSKIYIIKFYDNDKLIYIGSTTQALQKRLVKHKKHYHCSLYKYIFDNYDGDFKCCYIELFQNHSCNDKTELGKIEGEIIKQFKADENNIVINKNIAGRTNKEYYKDNINKIREYYKDNIDRIKQYYKNNADIKRNYQNEYNNNKKNYNNNKNK